MIGHVRGRVGRSGIDTANDAPQEAQRASSSPSQGPSALELIPPKIFLRPEGPGVPLNEPKEERNARSFRPQILFLHRFPGPKGPGWVNCWPTWAVRRKPSVFLKTLRIGRSRVDTDKLFLRSQNQRADHRLLLRAFATP